MKLEEIAFVKEGGAAVKKAGVGRVKRGDISATIKHVSELTGIPKKDLHPLGTTGKVADSGDIDLGVDSNEYDLDDVHQKMCDMLGDDQCHLNKGTRIGSYAIPIRGDESKGKVQVDLMFVPNVEWAKFAYFSAGEGSKYKGAIRTILLMAVAASIQEPGTDHFTYDPDTKELVIRAGRTLDLSKGLRRIFQYRPKRKSGTGYTKSMKSIPIEDFKQMHPDIEVKGGKIIVDDPKLVVAALFGRGVEPKDVNTAEQILSLIKKKFDTEKQEKIFKIAKERARGVIGKMRIPQEFE